MNELLRALSLTEAAEFAALGLVAVWSWHQRGGATRGWLAATFGALGIFLIISQFIPPGSPAAPAWVLPRFPPAGHPLPGYLDAYHYLFDVQ